MGGTNFFIENNCSFSSFSGLAHNTQKEKKKKKMSKKDISFDCICVGGAENGCGCVTHLY